MLQSYVITRMLCLLNFNVLSTYCINVNKYLLLLLLLLLLVVVVVVVVLFLYPR